jgi:uncharacterized protein HemX
MHDIPDQIEPASQPPPPPPAREQPGTTRWTWIAVLAALLVTGAVVVAQLQDQQRALAQQLQQRADELAGQHQRDQAQLREVEERIAATARRTEQLEQQLTVFAGRDPSADAELRRLREQSVLTEADELITLAISQLQVLHDPAAAASALATADARLARLPRTQLYPLREALARDIERLRKTPTVDLTGMAIRLDRLVQGVDSWHLLGDPTRRLSVPPPKPKAESGSAPAPGGRLGWLGREFGDAFRDLVRIRPVDAPEALLLPADQHQLVREHLRVRLLNARQAMLLRNEPLFRSDLADSQALIARYFDSTDPLVAAALAQLKTMATAAVDAPLPSLEDSQSALRSARPSAP